MEKNLPTGAKKKKIIPPGSPEWIDKIKAIQQEYETYYELLKIAEDQEAKFLGTSSKHLHKRKGLKTKSYNASDEDFKTFQPDYFEVCDASAPQYEDKGNTSDETTTLELRPNKRNTILVSHESKHISKKTQEPVYLKGDILLPNCCFTFTDSQFLESITTEPYSTS
ncbi:hypothetical protein RhiirA5_408210 [Rhizophagus irregularis]|uniref:Uncharacterized protein n=1 Tax=Rhizophagus irregularis TaxID=588596 RepID=A0A2N0Q8L6_9GLOM|nr:hypothetical protein RhiirA5_408210 [Rhizophagus irregularis]